MVRIFLIAGLRDDNALCMSQASLFLGSIKFDIVRSAITGISSFAPMYIAAATSIVSISGSYLDLSLSIVSLLPEAELTVMPFTNLKSPLYTEWTFLSQLITDKKAKLFCIFSLAAGFLAPLARGSWVAASALVVIFISIGPKVVKRYMILLVGLLIAIQVLPIFPAGKKIINLLPFIGNVDQFNVDYRERLVERSFILINRNPFFGVYDPMQHPFFEDMIQGQGIVDITNSYLLIGLNGGYTALILFVWFFVFTLFKLNKALKKVKDKKSEEHLCGRVLFATLSAVLINMISVGLILVIPTMVYILVGFIFSYIRIIEKNATIKY